MGLWVYRGLQRHLVARVERGARVAAQAGLLAGAAALTLVVLWLLGVSPGGIAVGGAVTGVVLGLAAQSTLANLFGGFILMALRPYLPGDRVTLRSAQFGGAEYTGVVRDLNFFYTVLSVGADTVFVPNSAAVGATVTRRTGERHPVAVRLPADCDLDAAREQLAERAPGAELILSSWTPEGAEVTVQAPAELSWNDLAQWARASGDRRPG